MKLHSRPLFLFTVAYICGVVCAVQSDAHVLAGFGVAGGLFLIGWALPSRVVARSIVGLFAAVFAVGFVRTAVCRQIPPGDISDYAEGKLVHLTGTVVSDPEPLGDRVRFVLRSKRLRTYTGEFPASGLTCVTLYRHEREGEAPRMPSYGELVRIHGRLRRPRESSKPGAVRYGDYLARKRVFCTLSAGASEVSTLSPPRWSLGGLAAKFKAGLISKAHELFPSVHARLLLGILLGDYASLPAEFQTSFMRCGTMHLFAASGFHCGVLALLFGSLFRLLTVPRAAAQGLLIALLWGYVLVVGPSPSIIRATVMMAVFVAAYMLWRAPDIMNIVLFACLVILGVNPLSLYDVGFQLSFAAVLAIVLIVPLVEPRLRARLRPARHPCGAARRLLLWAAWSTTVALVVSTAAVLGTWPITAYYFNYVSLVSGAANAIITTLVVLLAFTGIASLVLGSIWSVLGHAAAPLATGVAGAMLGIVSELGSYPWSAISVRSPSSVFIALYYIALFGALEYAHRTAPPVQGVAGDS